MPANMEMRTVKKECINPAFLKERKKRSFSIFYDNGVTPGSSSNNCGERPNLVRFNQSFTSLGWVIGLGTVGVSDVIGPYSSWSNQLNGWKDFGALHDPYGSTHAFNFQPAPTWRSWTIDGCHPEAQYGPWAIQRDDGCIFTVFPIAKTADVISKIYCLDSVDCDGNPKTDCFEKNESGEYVSIDTPDDLDCYMPCDYKFEPVIMPDAVSDCISQPPVILCDRNDGVDTAFVLIITDCGEERIRERYTLDSYNNAQTPDDLVEYEPTGTILTESKEPYTEPPAEPVNEVIESREVCLDVGGGVVLNAYAIVCISKASTTLVRYEDGFGNTVEGTPVTCTCDAVDVVPSDGIGDPLGDQTVCASRKLGADFTSNATGSATHTSGSLYDTNGAVDAWSGTFTVTDSSGATHVFTDGQTVTGLASGATQSVTFTGQVEWSDAGETYRCPVTDKAISANFTVQ